MAKGKYNLKFLTAASLAKCKQNYLVFKVWTNSVFWLCLNSLKTGLFLNCSSTPLNFLLLLLYVSIKRQKVKGKVHVIFSEVNELLYQSSLSKNTSTA